MNNLVQCLAHDCIVHYDCMIVGYVFMFVFVVLNISPDLLISK